MMYALLGQLRYDADEKAALVYSFSGNRTQKSSELTQVEAAALIKHLQGEVQSSIKKMRSKIINIGKDIGLAKANEVGVLEFDFAALNVFLVKKFKKQLHFLDRAELRNAVTAMEVWRESCMKKELQF